MASRLFRNLTSIAGAWLAALSLFAFLTFQVAEWFELVRSPYSGLVGFVVLPALSAVGLLLVAIGGWLESRRLKRGGTPWTWPTVDLAQPRTRRAAFAVTALALVSASIFALAASSTLAYMDTNAFCGQACHEPMRPQFMSHQVSPHARVDCVTCHISPGAPGAFAAKLNGTRQLYLLLTNGYARPIPQAHNRVPRAAATCLTCHDPGAPVRDITRVTRSYADDETSTEVAAPITILMSAVHWHARPDVAVDYVAVDAARESMPYVAVRVGAGPVTEYFAEGTTSPPAGQLHRMDCLDCHSRPAHGMSSSAGQVVDQAIARGEISRALPFARREVVAAVSREYADADTARREISRQLTEAFGIGPDAAQAVDVAERVYETNVFPEMNVTWGTYTSQLGHSTATGCFRCHDDTRRAADGRLIRQDCALCHRID